MAPVPRCNLRLPNESKHVSPKSKVADQSESPTDNSQQSDSKADSDRSSLHSQRSPTRDSAEILEGASEFSTGVTRDSGEIRDEHKQHEDAAASKDADAAEKAGNLEAARSQSWCYWFKKKIWQDVIMFEGTRKNRK